MFARKAIIYQVVKYSAWCVRLWVGGTGWSEGETKRDTVTGAFFVQVTNDMTSDTDTYGEKLSRISARASGVNLGTIRHQSSAQ